MNTKPDYLIKVAEELRPLYTLTDEDRPEAVPLSSPSVRDTINALKALIELFLPARRLRHCHTGQVFVEELPNELEKIYSLLRSPIKEALPYRWLAAAARGAEALNNSAGEVDEGVVEKTLERFFLRLPSIRELVVEDIQASYDGDPAALSYIEVTLCFPGLLAVVSHRIAHQLYDLQVPILPRLMAEWTHTKTGVDIHPGAKIGRSFFIDHATGVVIGETARIGNHVKLYQGVTLGAKSFTLDASGNPVKHIQRHPTVEDKVVIYANATILGGDTVIGAGTTIGGNAFITNSVPAGSLVFREEAPKVKAKFE